MSLIIKGIDLPKDEKKPLKIEIWSNGDIYKDYGYGYEYKESIAIQVPKDHGRIGDLDELQKAIRTDIMGGLNYKRYIDNAPTILEAEE